jgi:hypothetical protein
MRDQLSDLRTQVVPLLKGVTPGEREIFYRAFKKLGFDFCAFYGTQYFTQGPNISALSEDLHRISSEAPNLDIFLIGLLSPNYLRDLPANVVGAAGEQKWRREVGLRDDTVDLSEMRSRARGLSARVSEALSAGQAPLDLWMQSVDERVKN